MKPITQKLADLIRGANYWQSNSFTYGKRYWPAKPYLESQGVIFNEKGEVVSDFEEMLKHFKVFAGFFNLEDTKEYIKKLDTMGSKIMTLFNPEIEGK